MGITKKFSAISVAAAGFGLACSAANLTEIVNAGFEGGDRDAILAAGFAESPNAVIVKGADAIDGRYSVRFDAPDDGRHFLVMKFPVKNGAVYMYDIDYKVKKIGKFAPFSVRLGDARGANPAFVNVGLAVRIPNVKLKMKEGFRVPSDGKQYYFRINVPYGSSVVMDNVKIYELIPDSTNSYLFSENRDKFDLSADKTFPGMYYTPTAFSFLDPHSPILDMPREKFFPFIDKWGQYKYSDWPNKIKSDEDLKNAHADEVARYEKFGKIPNRDEYGALENSRGDFVPTGRFCIDKVDGKWYFRAPNGNLFWAFGLNSVGNFGATIIDGREHFFDDIDPENNPMKGYRLIRKVSRPILHYPPDARPRVFSFATRTYAWKYGLTSWAETAAKIKGISDWRMKNWGVSVYGCWTFPEILKNPVHPFILNTDAPKLTCASRKICLQPDPEQRKLFRMVPDVCDPRFRKILSDTLPKLADRLNSKWCVGIFIDNEITWETKEGYTTEAILTCPPEQAAKKSFRDFLKKRYPDIAALDEAWGAKYADWDAFLSERNFIPTTAEAKKDIDDFDAQFHALYYKICREELKKVSPDVLYMGSRFAWRNKHALRAAEKYCDVVSFNLYRDTVEGFDEIKDKPIIVGEFSFSRSDYGHFWKGIRQAANGKDQSAMFTHYMKSALRHPNFVGACWFTYGDQPTTARPDGENAAFGVVDICDTPHYDLIKTFRKISKKMFDIRAGK